VTNLDVPVELFSQILSPKKIRAIMEKLGDLRQTDVNVSNVSTFRIVADMRTSTFGNLSKRSRSVETRYGTIVGSYVYVPFHGRLPQFVYSNARLTTSAPITISHS
jgi:hypothetical protein